MPSRCNCRFCPRCSIRLGVKLRERLARRFRTFRRVYMVTLTLDPAFFRSPADAWAFVNEKRFVARFVQQLHRWGYLPNGRHYASIFETQPESEMPHWHVIIDAECVPFDDRQFEDHPEWYSPKSLKPDDRDPSRNICEAWNQNLAAVYAAVEQGDERVRMPGQVRAGLGSVQFSTDRAKKLAHGADSAAAYVSKYVTKAPKGGWPEWVMGSRKRIRRFSTSRGFWGEESDSRPEPEDEECGHVDPCPTCGEPCDECECDQPDDGRTIRERVMSCAGSVYAIRRTWRVWDGTGELQASYQMLGLLTLTTRELCEGLGVGTRKGQSIIVTDLSEQVAAECFIVKNGTTQIQRGM